jgi:hypothetical protein
VLLIDAWISQAPSELVYGVYPSGPAFNVTFGCYPRNFRIVGHG